MSLKHISMQEHLKILTIYMFKDNKDDQITRQHHTNTGQDY